MQVDLIWAFAMAIVGINFIDAIAFFASGGKFAVAFLIQIIASVLILIFLTWVV